MLKLIDPADITPRRRTDAEIRAEVGGLLKMLAANASHDTAEYWAHFDASIPSFRRRSGHRPATLAADATLRELAERLYPGMTANYVAGELAAKAARYQSPRYLHDRANGAAPTEEPLHTFFHLLEAGKKLSQRSIRRALANERN